MIALFFPGAFITLFIAVILTYPTFSVRAQCVGAYLYLISAALFIIAFGDVIVRWLA